MEDAMRKRSKSMRLVSIFDMLLNISKNVAAT
jgi:hypothetical protein